jgi:hypothetical protein
MRTSSSRTFTWRMGTRARYRGNIARRRPLWSCQVGERVAKKFTGEEPEEESKQSPIPSPKRKRDSEQVVFIEDTDSDVKTDDEERVKQEPISPLALESDRPAIGRGGVSETEHDS